MDVIEQIYYGQLNVNEEKPIIKNPELDAAMQHFKAGLSTVQQRELGSLLDRVYNNISEENYWIFHRGVQIGFYLCQGIREHEDNWKGGDL